MQLHTAGRVLAFGVGFDQNSDQPWGSGPQMNPCGSLSTEGGMIRQQRPQQCVGASGSHSWALRKNSLGVDLSDDVAHDAPLGHGLQLTGGERCPGTVQVLMKGTFLEEVVCCLHSVSMAGSAYSHKTLIRSVDN
jgi:hypothetical protein